MASSAFLSKVSFVNKISMLMKATSDNDSPLPGYLYSEINNITLESVESCENTLDFLVDRLSENSCHVKLKVLKVMRHLVENGHINFRLGLLKKSRGIKEATKFSGPPDPLHGNVPYQMVRKTAQDLSQVLFNIEAAGPEVHPPASSTKSSLLGYGPANILSSSSSSYSDRPRMEGFGNTTSQQSKSVGENIKDGILKMAESLGETTADQQRALLSKLESKSDYRPPPLINQTSPVNIIQEWEPANHKPQTKVSFPKHVPGRAGGGWDDDEDEGQQYSRPDLQKSHTRSSGSGSTGLAERLENVSVEDWLTEETLVNSYTENAPGSLLKRSQITMFVRDCAGLNCDKIVEFLNRSLQSADDKILMKTMLLLEGLMTSDLVNLERLTSVCRDNLALLYRSKQGPPQSKSRKIIRILEKLTSQRDIISLQAPQTAEADTMISLDNLAK